MLEVVNLYKRIDSYSAAGGPKARRKISLKIAGQKVQNSNVSASNDTTAIFEVGYQFSPYFSTALTFGVPPTSKIKGVGSILGAGHFGSVSYAPAMLIGQYWLPVSDYVKPYIGAGVVYYSALRSKDGALQDLEVDNGWGAV
jgi:outer membrane protein